MFAELAAAALLAPSLQPAACRAELPDGPAVPAPIVFRTSCGGFLLGPTGRVTRLSQRWFSARAGGTGRAYGADLQIRRNRAGRIFLLRRGRLVWRSQGLYPNTAGDVAFGPNRFAFSSYYRGVFLTDLRSPERLVVPGRARYPHGFFAGGRLVVAGGAAISVLTRDGRVERRVPFNRRGGYAFDEDANTLYFVTARGRLGTLTESRLRVGRFVGAHGSISLVEPQRLLFYGVRSLTLTSAQGVVVARARWRRTGIDVLDVTAVSPDAQFVAYRLTDARHRARVGKAVVFLVRAGDTRARPVYRHRLGPIGCGAGVSMRWHRHHLLYGSSPGQLAIIDARSGRRRDLSRFARALPGRASTGRVLPPAKV